MDKLTATQAKVLSMMAESPDRRIHRLPGGFWTVKGVGIGFLGRVPAWYCSIRTLRALEKRGLIRRCVVNMPSWMIPFELVNPEQGKVEANGERKSELVG